MNKEKPHKKNGSKESEELQSDQEIVQNKATTLKKELASKRAQLDLLLKSFPKEKPSPESDDLESYSRLEKQIDNLKKTISEKQNELMDLLKDQSDVEEIEEDL